MRTICLMMLFGFAVWYSLWFRTPRPSVEYPRDGGMAFVENN